jgi:hypothetical protein
MRKIIDPIFMGDLANEEQTYPLASERLVKKFFGNMIHLLNKRNTAITSLPVKCYVCVAKLYTKGSLDGIVIVC